TLTVAVLLVSPVPPSVDVTALVVLLCSPAAVPVTLTMTVQELTPGGTVAARVTPDRLTTLVPCVAVTLAPEQEPETTRPFGVDTTRPAGSVSENPIPLSAVVVLLLRMVNVSEVEPFSGIDAAPNALLMVGGPITVREALPVVLGPPSVDVLTTE